MRRFFIDKNNITKGGLVITGKEAHHIKDVIRLRPDDRFIGFDGEGQQYTCRINKIDRNKVEAVIEHTQESMLKIPNVTLACAIPKMTRMNYIVQKAAELRVQSLIPMQTSRTMVKLNKQRAGLKIKRWERIAKESSKQCGRNEVLKITELQDFSKVVENSNKYKIKLIPCFYNKARPIRDVLSKLQSDSVMILIGPEGDFTPDEVKLAAGAGFTPLSLGAAVLRVDTAAIFTLSAVMYELSRLSLDNVMRNENF